MTESSETPEPPKPLVDWRTLSEQTGYKVLTLPDGGTVEASDIRWVRLSPEKHYDSINKTMPAHVDICTRDGAVPFTIYEEADDFLAMATMAHRRAPEALQALGDQASDGSRVRRQRRRPRPDPNLRAW